MRILTRMVEGASLLAAFLMLSGCATHALWKDGSVSFHEPFPPARVALFDAPARKDVIVQYDELSPGHDTPRRRAYFLFENADRISTAKKPRFVSLSITNGLAAIPLYSEQALQQSRTNLPMVYALSDTNGNRFSVYRNNEEWHSQFQLPTYRCWLTSLRRGLLTPFAIALDATVIGGVIYVWGRAAANTLRTE